MKYKLQNNNYHKVRNIFIIKEYFLNSTLTRFTCIMDKHRTKSREGHDFGILRC